MDLCKETKKIHGRLATGGPATCVNQYGLWESEI